MARRPFLTSLVWYSKYDSASPRENPRGSKNGPPTTKGSGFSNILETQPTHRLKCVPKHAEALCVGHRLS